MGFETPSFEHGFKRAIAGFATALVLNALIEPLNSMFEGVGLRWIRSLVILVLSLASLVEGMEEAENMKYWGSPYLLGYLMAQSLIMWIAPDPLTFIAIMFGAIILLTRISRTLE